MRTLLITLLLLAGCFPVSTVEATKRPESEVPGTGNAYPVVTHPFDDDACRFFAFGLNVCQIEI